MKKTTLFGLISLAVIFLSGCQNTLKGFGQDMQNNGQEIQKSVNNK